MSPTISDEPLVRELRESADATLPPMGLRPDNVLEAGRRYRRRRTAVRAAGATVVAAVVAVVGGELAGLGPWDPTPVPPAQVDQAPNPLGDGQTVELAPGVIAANRPVEITLPDGTPVLDLGIMTPGATQVPATDPLVELPLAVAPITTEQLEDANFADMAPPSYDSGVQVTHLWESGLSPFETSLPWSTQEATFDYEAHGYLPSPPAFTAADSEIDGSPAALLHGAVPASVPDPRTVLFAAEGFQLADGQVVRYLEIPTYRSPTEDERLLWTVRITAEQEVANLYSSPTLVVLFIGSDGSVVPGLDCGGVTLEACAEVVGPEIYAAADLVTEATDTLRIETATDVTEADSSAGPVLDLGIPVLNDVARQTVDGREEMTYALKATTWGEATGDTTLSEAEAGAQAVILAGRRSFGALTPMRASVVTGPRDTVDATGHRDTYDGSPVLSAGISESDTDVLGLLPEGATGATLVVERATGTERIDLPTFNVPGLPDEAAFFFFTLHDDVTQVTSASAHLELAAEDGTVTRWAVTGAPLNALTVEVGDQ